MPSVEANGLTIEYDVRGEGEPVLLVMGLAGQLVDWPDDFVDLYVEAGYQVIRFDNRDIGLSSETDWTPPSEVKTLRSLITRRPLKGVGYTVPDMAADAAGLLEALDIERAHVVGASMGGMIAQEMAINHPETVRSICSIMSNVGDRRNGGISGRLIAKVARRKPPTRETAVDDAVRIFGLIAGPHFDPDEYRILAKRQVERSFRPAGVARQTAAIAGTRNRAELLGSVTAPTLVIHGLLDPLVKPSGGVATARAVPGARLLAFPDMAHDMPRPRWPEMRDAMIENFSRA
jgi:pimeloyl-ACP methyl ester carboxylesterase